MDSDKFFGKVDNLVQEFKGKTMDETLKVTITYTTGEKDVFKATLLFWANMLVATKNRKKYLYYQSHLINLDHVVKVQYEDLSLENNR